MEKLSYSLWAIIVCSAYSFIFYQLYKKDKEKARLNGVKYFSFAIFIFAVAATINAIIEYFCIDCIIYSNGLEAPFIENNQISCPDTEKGNCITKSSYMYYGFRAFLSMINNILLLMTIPFIELGEKRKKWQEEIITGIKEKRVLYVLFFMDLCSFALCWMFFNSKSPYSPLKLLLFDSIISVVVILLLALFTYTALTDRGFIGFRFICWFTFFLMLITQILQYIPEINSLSSLTGPISSSYKTLLMGLFLILLYTSENKEKKEAKKLVEELKFSSEIFHINANVDTKIIRLNIDNSHCLHSDFSKSPTLFNVLIKFIYNKTNGDSPLRVKSKKDERNNHDFTYNDRKSICEKLSNADISTEFLSDSLFSKTGTNEYKINILKSNIEILGSSDELMTIVKSKRAKEKSE